MKDSEFVTTVTFNGIQINVGLDDAGQSYFIEFETDEGCQAMSVGSYNTDYMGFIEFCFGDPTKNCDVYSEIKKKQNLAFDNLPEDCPHRNKYGFCDRCPYQDYDWYVLTELRRLGVLNRHGDHLTPRFKHLFERSLDN